ncbi:MAG TPA: FlgD immunoglobulin-like domain containing protein [Spirochaetia bacterium]|nr:FlgD immunoglobulin-like domain containing protein [Spirochaetia bacterium]
MRRSTFLFLASAALAILALAGCQTAKPVSVQQSMIRAGASGFAPGAGADHNTIAFNLSFGNSDMVKTWLVQVAGPGGAVKTYTGDGKNLPATLSWDGKSDAGAVVQGGTYTASLTVSYAGKLPTANATSGSFVVDTNAPIGSLSVNPSQFTPGAQGMTSPLTLTVTASSSLAKISAWTIKIYDASGNLFQTFSGAWPDSKVTWDGKGSSGEYAKPSTTYSAVATVSDEYGLDGIAKATIPVAAEAAQQEIVPTTVPVGRDAIQADLNGFSPMSETGRKTIQLYLTFANPVAVHSWTVTIASDKNGVVKTYTGDAQNMSASLTWDGKDETGHFAADGTYAASLSVNYGTAMASSPAASKPFILDVTAPSGRVTLSEKLFSPEETSKTIALTVDASSPVAAISNWTMNIISPEGSVFRTFSGSWPDNRAIWDGTSSSGAFVESAEDYPVRAKVTDEFGNVGELEGNVPVDILVFNTREGYRIQSSRIFFKPFTADYRDVPPDIAHQNMVRLDQLAEKLKRFPADKVKIVGHAVMIYWDNPALGKIEQQDVLVPLSQARAKAIEEALMERGLRPAMFITDGVGASDQIVPDSDYKDRWQNRRVALFVEK